MVLTGRAHPFRAIGSLKDAVSGPRKHRGESLSVALVVVHQQDGFRQARRDLWLIGGTRA